MTKLCIALILQGWRWLNVEFLLLVSVRSCFVLVYVRAIILLARCFITLHPGVVFLICCNCCLHFIPLVQLSCIVLVPPHFCHIFVPFLKQNKTSLPFGVFSPFLLIYSSHHRLSSAERWPKLHIELCLYTLGNAKPALPREVQLLRSFSGLTAAFVSHCIWSKYVSASLGVKKEIPLKSGKLPELGNKPKTIFSEEGWENEF